jgi:hypothetical protein
VVKLERKQAEGATQLTLRGEIDEEFDLHEEFRRLSGAVSINLREVDYIDSSGLREWIKAVSAIPRECRVEFHEVSVRFVYQLNMSLNARGHGRVVSFIAPYYCGRCDQRRDTLLVVDAYPQQLGRAESISVPSQQCSECGTALVFDELPEEYFLFLKMQQSQS